MPNLLPIAIIALIGGVLQVPVLVAQGLGPSPNLPIVTLSFWFLYLDISTFINFVWWRSNDVSSWKSGSGWCDIDNSLYGSANLGVLLAALSISIHLYYLSRPTARRLTPRRVKVWQAIDALILFAIPVAYAIVRPFTDTGRYFLVQNIGCQQDTGVTAPFVVFLVAVPILLAILLSGLSLATILQFILRGKESVYQALSFKEKFSVNFYIRTMVCTGTVLVACIPLMLAQCISSLVVHNGKINELPWAHGKPVGYDFIFGLAWEDAMSTVGASTLVPISIAFRMVTALLSFVSFFCFALGDTAIICYRQILARLHIIRQPTGAPDSGTPISWTTSEAEHKKCEISVHVGPYVPSPS